jgi:hypothetical protein
VTGGFARLLAASALVAVALLGPAGPAAADAAGPTDYRTEIVGFAPAVDGVVASVVGGDSFLRLEVAPGTEVLVVGYRGEPFIRFLPSGVVEENRRSPSWYLSQDRYGTAEVPADATEDTEPEWVQVATDGSWAWHDHRSHWMGAAPPLGARPGDVVLEAVVPLRVDGRAVDLSVRSTLQATPSRVPAVAVGVLVGVAVLALARATGLAGVGAALSGLAAVALLVGAWTVRSVPAETGPSPLHWALALAALVPAVAGTWSARHGSDRRPRPGPPILVGGLLALAAAELVLWAWTRLDVLSAAILPTDAPFWLDRATTAAAFLGGVVALGVVLRALLRRPDPS